jgi:osmoprotectant transport system permease protein
MRIPRIHFLIAFVVVAVLAAAPTSVQPAGDEGEVVRVGAKNFTESYVLAEMFAQLLEGQGYEVQRRFGLGGSLVCFKAITSGEIDVYPEYTGTLAQAILKLDGPVSNEKLRRLLEEEHGLELLRPLGFNNTYAIALTRSRAGELGVEAIGDLADHPDLKIAFSYEFLNRQDGWPGLAQTYNLPHKPDGIEHGLAYQAIADGKIDVTDVYSTDGDIEKYDLVVLEDDKGYFPEYLAAPLVREDVSSNVKVTLDRLAGRIDAEAMRALNADALLGGASFAEVASGFLQEKGLAGEGISAAEGRWERLGRRTLRHLELTFIALLAAMALSIPAGILVYRSRRFSRPVIYVAGALQTIPSIALLAFMIPLFGIGVLPAIVALFLYALLPILRNTAAALVSIDPVLKKVAAGMGLTRWQQLRHVELPLATPTILAGIKTAAVINIGTATLAAFIGAGGLGEPIVTGLALNDTGLIMEGAVPAAALAVAAELVFEAIERVAVPKHLQSSDVG